MPATFDMYGAEVEFHNVANISKSDIYQSVAHCRNCEVIAFFRYKFKYYQWLVEQVKNVTAKQWSRGTISSLHLQGGPE